MVTESNAKPSTKSSVQAEEFEGFSEKQNCLSGTLMLQMSVDERFLHSCHQIHDTSGFSTRLMHIPSQTSIYFMNGPNGNFTGYSQY